MIGVNKPCSLIVLNINGLNFPKKDKHCIRKQGPSLCYIWESQDNINGKHHLWIKEQKKIPENRIKQRGIALLIFKYSLKQN